MTRDPIGFAGGIDLYGYCGSGPIGAADPSGLMRPTGSVDADGGVNVIPDATVALGPGEDDTDPDGNPVRIGGWPSLVNKHNNGMTINGTVHFKGRQSFESYKRDRHWQNHEEGHLAQDFSTRDIPYYAACQVVGFFHEMLTVDGQPSKGGGTGHDYNWYEMDAEGARTRKGRCMGVRKQPRSMEAT